MKIKPNKTNRYEKSKINLPDYGNNVAGLGVCKSGRDKRPNSYIDGFR
jgi:hypothetical protein